MKWSFSVGDNFVSCSPAIGPNGTIYVSSGDMPPPDYSTGHLYALNLNGTMKWSFPLLQLNGNIGSSPVIGLHGTIYIGSADNNLYAINPDGTKKWTFSTGKYILSSPAIGPHGTVYIGSTDRRLYAVNPDGTQKWFFNLGGRMYSESSPTVGPDGTIYAGSSWGNVYAINPDGSMKWEFSVGGKIMGGSPSIGSDGTIYIGSWDNHIYAINPNGTQKWSFPTGDIVDSTPAIGSDGTVYIGSWDNKLYALSGESGGLAKAPWPTFQHDIRHTGRVSQIAIGGFEVMEDQHEYAPLPPGDADVTQVILVADNDEDSYPVRVDKITIKNLGTASGSDIKQVTIRTDGKQETLPVHNFPVIWQPSDLTIPDDISNTWKFEVMVSNGAARGRTIQTKVIVKHSEGGQIFTKSATDGAPEEITGNHPPIANAGPDQSVSLGDLVHLDGTSSSDQNGDQLSYRWSFISKPSGSKATLSDPNDPKLTFKADRKGEYKVQLVVNDGKVDSKPDEVKITATKSTVEASLDHFLDEQGNRYNKNLFIAGKSYTVVVKLVNHSKSQKATFNPDSAMTYFVDMPGDFGNYQSTVEGNPSFLHVTKKPLQYEIDLTPRETKKVQLFSFKVPEQYTKSDIVWTDQLIIEIILPSGEYAFKWSHKAAVSPGIGRCLWALGEAVLSALSGVNITVTIGGSTTIGTLADIISTAKTAGEISKQQIKKSIHEFEELRRAQDISELAPHYIKGLELLTVIDPTIAAQVIIGSIRDLAICAAYGLEAWWHIGKLAIERGLMTWECFIEALRNIFGLPPIITAIRKGKIDVIEAITHDLIGTWKAIEESLLKAGSLIHLYSPADLLIRDTQGRRVGYKDGSKYTEIPGSKVFINNHQVYATLPPVVREYVVIVKGTETGQVSLEIGVMEASIVKGVRYQNITIKTESSLQVRSLANNPQGIMQVDRDGDGNYEKEKPPDKLINKEKLQSEVIKTIAQYKTNCPFNISNPGIYVCDVEILQAVTLWMNNKIVPGTNTRINGKTMRALVAYWKKQKPINQTLGKIQREELQTELESLTDQVKSTSVKSVEVSVNYPTVELGNLVHASNQCTANNFIRLHLSDLKRKGSTFFAIISDAPYPNRESLICPMLWNPGDYWVETPYNLGKLDSRDYIFKVYSGHLDQPEKLLTQTQFSVRESQEEFEVEKIMNLPNPVKNSHTTFIVEGKGIDAIKVQIFDLAGFKLFDSGWVGNNFGWNLLDEDGEILDNGVYLYVVLVRGVNGEMEKSAVKKLLILR